MRARLYSEIAASSHGRGPRVTLLHGFTQTRLSWGRFADELARHHELLTVDAPGHGRSSALTADVPAAALLLTATGGTGAYLGYSMGARICLRAALDHPGSVTALVMLSGSPGIANPAEREARHEADQALAGSIVETGEFVDRWLSQSLFSTLSRSRADRESRLENTPEGLRSSLRLCGTGTQDPLWDRLGELAMPVLLVAGAEDSKFCTTAGSMAEAIGENATVEVVDGAGHAVYLEQPRRTAEVVHRFLAEYL